MLNLHSDILKYASALKYAPVGRTTPRKYAKFEQYLSKKRLKNFKFEINKEKTCKDQDEIFSKNL